MNRTPTAAHEPARPSAAAKQKAKTTAEDATPVGSKVPGLDLRALLDKLRLPGIDVAALIDSRRHDVDALLAANEQAYRGFEAVTRRQSEMLAEAMKELGEVAKEALNPQSPADRAARVATHAQQAFGQALANMKEIAELSARSQKQVVETLRSRLRESVDEAGKTLVRRTTKA